MNTARLAIAAAVLAALGGVVWWSNQREAAKADLPDPNAPPKILTVAEEGLQRIEFRHRGDQETTVLERQEGGGWKITSPRELTADLGLVAGVTSAASSLSSTRVVDENAADLAGYGLDPALITVAFTFKDGTTKTLRIGDDTPDRGGTYAAVDGDPRLFTMAASSKTSFDKRAKDLREKHLLVFNPDQVSRLELAAAGQPNLAFERNQDSKWEIAEPRPLRADSFKVEQLLGVIKDAEMDVDADEAQVARAYRSGRRVATASLTAPDGEMTFQVRESGGEYYASSSALPGAYKVGPAVGTGVDKTLDDFRNRKLFDFGFDDLSRIEISDKGELREFEKVGENWMESGARTMDSVSVQNLIDKLRNLSAATFDDASIDQPEIEITVVSKPAKGGERTERLAIFPSGDQFIAQRDDGPATYSLTKADVDGLREALSAVRPPAEDEGKAKEP